MPEKDIFGSGQAVLMLWTTENRCVLRNFKYHHQNGLTFGTASKATVIATLAIWEKARILCTLCTACGFRTLYESYSLLKKNRLKRINIFIDSDEVLNESLTSHKKM